MQDKKLYRSRYALLGGVCSGLARRADADPIVVRIMVVLLTFVTAGAAVVAYAYLWVSLPLESEDPEPLEVVPESAESSVAPCVALGAKAELPQFNHRKRTNDGALLHK